MDGGLALQAAIPNPGGYRGKVTSIANLFVCFVSEAKKRSYSPTHERETHTPTQDTRLKSGDG